MKISKEQIEAIEMLDKFITEHKLYNIKQSDGLEDNIKIVLYLIEKLQKENEELNKENEHLHREINRRIKLKIENEKIVDTQFIYKQKIKDKIKELSEIKGDFATYIATSERIKAINERVLELQELLRREKKMSEEEKKAICELKNYISRRKLNYTKLDRHDKSIDNLLNLIEKLQKENKKYKQFFDLMLILDSDYFMNCGDEETNKLVDEILKLESE